MESEGGLKNTILSSVLILVFEALGTAILALNYLTFSDWASGLCAYFIALIMGMRISGSHYNPAVTIAFMLRKDVGRFSRVLGIAYIIF